MKIAQKVNNKQLDGYNSKPGR